MVYTVRLKGKFNLKEEDILRFHPWIEPLLEEIKKRGWKYEISNVDAEAHANPQLPSTTHRRV